MLYNWFFSTKKALTIVLVLLFFSFQAYGSESSSTRVYIVHGYLASPSDHWFGWLKNELLSDGYQVSVLSLPDSANPDVKRWVKTLDQEIQPLPDKDTYFIAHSLGGITLLRYIQENTSKTIGGLILVSGFAQPLPNIPKLDAFTNYLLDTDDVVKKVKSRDVISARDDSIVSYSLSESLSDKIQADFHLLNKGGHFLASDGYRKFPLLLREARAMINDK